MKVATFIDRKIGLRGIFMLSLCSVLTTGCGSTTTTLAPISPVAVIDTDKTVPEAPVPNAGAAISGRYPGFNGPLLAAGPQMSDEEAGTIAVEMEALSKRRRSGTVSAAAYNKRLVELQALARDHGSDTLKEIQK